MQIPHLPAHCQSLHWIGLLAPVSEPGGQLSVLEARMYLVHGSVAFRWVCGACSRGQDWHPLGMSPALWALPGALPLAAGAERSCPPEGQGWDTSSVPRVAGAARCCAVRRWRSVPRAAALRPGVGITRRTGFVAGLWHYQVGKFSVH